MTQVTISFMKGDAAVKYGDTIRELLSQVQKYGGLLIVEVTAVHVHVNPPSEQFIRGPSFVPPEPVHAQLAIMIPPPTDAFRAVEPKVPGGAGVPGLNVKISEI